MKIKLTNFLAIVCLLALIVCGCVKSQPTGFSGITYDDDILYFGSMDGQIIAVNLSARSQHLIFPAGGEWSYAIIMASGGGFSCGPTFTPVAIYGVPAVDGDLVFIGGYNGKVYALSALARSQNLDFPQTRENEWFYPKTSKVVGNIVGSPVVSDGAIYLTSSDGKVYSLDGDFGDKRWESDILDNKLWSTPCVEGDSVYITTFDGHLYALSVEDGGVTWSFTMESGIGFVSSPLVYEGTIFASSFDGNLYAVEIGGDEHLWEFSGGNCFWATPVASNGTLYAGCLDGKVYAIDADNGTELWSFDVGSPIVVSPLLKDDLLIVTSDAGVIYLLETDATVYNRVVKEVSVDVSVRAATCVQDGIVYVRGQDNYLYAADIDRGEVIWRLPLSITEDDN